MQKNIPLFPPWDAGHWEQVDDTVRGGSSESHLVPYRSRESDEEKWGGSKFYGTLDIKTLGGAGFASQRYTFSPPLSIPPSYEGILLRLLPIIPPIPSSPTRFTLTLATTPRTRRASGRTASRLQYEANFSAPTPQLKEGLTSTNVEIRLLFENFEATYRGRPVEKGDENWEPLRTEEIFDVSIMCRSGFGDQEGEFELKVLTMEAYRRASTKWWGLWGWWIVCWHWLRRHIYKMS